MRLTRQAIDKAVSLATTARNELTTKVGQKHHAKACCVCDRLIRFGEERSLSLDDLKHSDIKHHFLDENAHFEHYHTTTSQQKKLLKFYKQRCYPTREHKYRFLSKLVLSRASYATKVSGKEGFGCCKGCHASLMNHKRHDVDEPTIPKYAIFNGLLHGPAPIELTRLNEVELSLVSINRTNKHIFSFTAGAHKSIRGWHSMYYNDLESVNGVVNWCVQATTQSADGDDDIESDEEDYIRMDGNDNTPRRRAIPNIAVVLCGPFTAAQKAKVQQRTTVNWTHVQAAVKWLKKNNHLYKDYNLSESTITKPYYVDRSTEAESQDNNIERLFEINAVFPDSNEPAEGNGGCNTRSDFKELTLDRILANDDQKEATVFSRPTTNVLRDYQGDNLIKAFPLQFPYGIGAYDAEGEQRSGTGYLKYLTTLRLPAFHRPEFVCITHNMFERQRMVSNSYIKTSDQEAENFANITPEEMNDAIDRLADGSRGSGDADQFLKRMKAVCSAMAHTEGAAKKARQKMFAMIQRFGLPAVMFTITPEDSMNFRIRIMAKGSNGEQNPPTVNNNHEVLCDFVTDCAKLRSKYPGFCSFDFEQVIAITVRHLLGWDNDKKVNIENVGLFGDLDAWTYTVEEQGRKTLHAHFLLWVKDWRSLINGLANDGTRAAFENHAKSYAGKIMTSHLFGDNCNRPKCKNTCTQPTSPLSHCSEQDIRNMRTRSGETVFGGKTIVKCESCGFTATSEELVLQRVRQLLHIDPGNDLWGPVNMMSKCQVHLEIMLMNSLVPPGVTQSTTTPTTKFVIAVLRNLHSSGHCFTCFKKGHECRMKLPAAACNNTQIHYALRPTKWYDMNGICHSRNLYTMELKRSLLDYFVNVYNDSASNIFGCNTNVVSCVDGGSVMYMTCYISKNTQKEDNEHFGKAAKHMINKLKEGVGNSTADDDVTAGMKSLIGAALLATKAHICSAPMAAYLTRHGSRFHYSHDFAYVNIRDFEEDRTLDYELSDTDGAPFIKSAVANYLHRPIETENECLYDFLSKYTVSRKSARSLAWYGEHPSNDHLAVSKSKYPKIPMVNYLDFIDTKGFGERSILSTTVPPEGRDRGHHLMEQYARRACILFLPFRRVGDLRMNGHYVYKYQNAMRQRSIPREHLVLLQNMQDCRNSLNAGRPPDGLEMRTEEPPRSQRNTDDDDEDDQQDVLEEAFDELVDGIGNINDTETNQFKGPDGEFSLDTMLTRKLGTHRCGTDLLPAPPRLPDDHSVINTTEVSQHESDNGSSFGSGGTLTPLALHKLAITSTTRVTSNGNGDEILATGTLRNIREYASLQFGSDDDQKRAFECITAAFVLQIHKEAHCNYGSGNAGFGSDDGVDVTAKKRKLDSVRSTLEKVNRNGQFIAFLSGAGGSGKSHVINTVTRYAANFCSNLKIPYNKRSIVVTALTGSAAVAINGETTHGACALYRRISTEVEEFSKTYMIIVDEISFANRKTLELLHEKLGEIRQNQTLRYGGIPILFAGDFTQLRPVSGDPLYLFPDFDHWWDWVHTMFELRTNHRFHNDKAWGKLLERYRDNGPSSNDVDKINRRVVDTPNGPKSTDIPSCAVYAVKSNIDRCAINDGVFVNHVHQSCSQDPSVAPPLHTICIQSSELRLRKSGKKKEYTPMNAACADLFYGSCSDAHVKGADRKFTDPMLKLYDGCPVSINHNLDVARCIANGAMGLFRGVTLKEGVTINDMEKVIIDGYYVWCVKASQVKSIEVEMIDGSRMPDGSPRIVSLEARKTSARVRFPIPLLGRIDKKTPRVNKGVSLLQFPVNVSVARTVHKLQGRSIEHLVISTWDYTDNWIYVCLSRCRTLNGLYLRKPLDRGKTRGMSEECVYFHEYFRKEKRILPMVALGRDH